MPGRLIDIRLRGSRSDARPVDLPTEPAEVRLTAGVLGRELGPGRTRLDVRGVSGDRLEALVQGLVLGSYRFSVPSGSDASGQRVDLCGADRRGNRALLIRALRGAAATAWARDLANTRSNTKTPAWLGEQAVDRLTRLGVQVEVRDDAWLAEQGFGGMLAVGGGSASPPRFIEAAWQPRRAAKRVHLVLVGKGITFDTGGVNLKRGDAARTMYTDMAGGAAVLGALGAIASAELPVRVTALVPAAENSLSGSSFRPGDVVRHYGGRTSEIGNTDAEGRLVLADAIAYAVARQRPSAVVDVATLTGAMKTALGLRTAGLLATDDRVADGLLSAGAATGEPLWRMPLEPAYEQQLRSEFADATNAPGNPGGITAALFLKHFVGDVPWAHLDIAGPARAAEDDGMFSVGATGFGARLLAAYAASLA